MDSEVTLLRAQLASLQLELDNLRAQQTVGSNAQRPATAAAATDATDATSAAAAATVGASPAWDGLQHGLSRDQIARYSRQVILHSFGVQGEMHSLTRQSVDNKASTRAVVPTRPPPPRRRLLQHKLGCAAARC